MIARPLWLDEEARGRAASSPLTSRLDDQARGRAASSRLDDEVCRGMHCLNIAAEFF